MGRYSINTKLDRHPLARGPLMIDVVEVPRSRMDEALALSWEALAEASGLSVAVRRVDREKDRVGPGLVWLRRGPVGSALDGRPMLYQQGW